MALLIKLKDTHKMTVEKTILGVVPAMQATALLAGTIPRKRQKKRKLLRSTAKILVGVPMIQATSQVIGGMN